MNAKKCDRCGDMYTYLDCGSKNGYEINTFQLSVVMLCGQRDDTRLYTDAYDRDLCPGCYHKLLAWFIRPNAEKYTVEKNKNNLWIINRRKGETT